MSRLSRRVFLRAAITLALLTVGGCGPTPTPTPRPTATSTLPKPLPTVATPQSSPTAVGRPTLPTTTPVPMQPSPTAVAARQPTPPPTGSQAYMAVARGGSPEAITRAAIAAVGGIGRFVRAGADVIIKPNICSASYPYEYAATTNPEVVATLVKLCREAGAKRVRVMDYPFSGTDGQAYAISGIEEATRAAGGEMERMARMKYQNTPIPQGRDIKEWPVYQDALKADVLINVPIAKNHSLARLTLGMKNMMGLILDRGSMHYNLGQRLADLNSLLAPTLTVVDAVRIMTRGGPTGGNLNYVKKIDTVVVSHDVVAADAYAATLFGMTGDDLDYVRAGAAMGLGRKDIDNVKIERIEL